MRQQTDRKTALLTYNRVVCCVKFSNDGQFLATGCNRTAQIYNVKTGAKVWYVFI